MSERVGAASEASDVGTSMGRSIAQRLVVWLGGPKAAVDAALLVAFTLGTFALTHRFDAMEAMIEWSETHEEYEADEYFALLIISSFALLVFALRRMAELRAQVRLRGEAEERTRHIAMHDSLTGLPNRAMFQRRLDQELARARRDGTGIAVLAIDLDRFKQVNDVFGHAVGDELLRAVTARFVSVTRRMDTVARLGGDEFVIIQPLHREPDDAVQLADRLVRSMQEPLQLKEQQILCTLSVGVALLSPALDSAIDLMRGADIALYRAKADGRSVYRFFEADMDAHLQARQQLERDLREAIAAGHMTLHYQPLVHLPERTLLGFEALLRWTHAERGPVSPADFIPIAEETGLIVALGEWALSRACHDAMCWDGDYKVAINLSPAQFKHRDLLRRVEEVLAESGLPPTRLELEITEGVLMENTEAALEILNGLKRLGVRISMDDFGTGYSSLSYLKRFPFDKIKIDRSFISHLESQPEDAAIVRAVLAMGRSLGMVTTAEGVESGEQLSYLQGEGCDEAQGYLLGRPMGFDEAMSLSRRSVDGTPL